MSKVITGPRTRWSYVNVWEPKSINGSAPKYSVSLLIPKNDVKTIRKIRDAITQAYEEGKSELQNPKTGKMPPLDQLKSPLRDGDEERSDDPVYEGCYFINANSSQQPGIVDSTKQEILDRSEVYSGCYGRASVNFYAYNTNGNKGIACGLNNLMKVKDGEYLGGRVRAEDDFNDLDDEDEENLGF